MIAAPTSKMNAIFSIKRKINDIKLLTAYFYKIS